MVSWPYFTLGLYCLSQRRSLLELLDLLICISLINIYHLSNFSHEWALSVWIISSKFVHIFSKVHFPCSYRRSGHVQSTWRKWFSPWAVVHRLKETVCHHRLWMSSFIILHIFFTRMHNFPETYSVEKPISAICLRKCISSWRAEHFFLILLSIL